MARLFALLGTVGAFAEDEGKLRVLCTFAPIYSLTRNVAGDLAEVEVLLRPSDEPHDLALSPSDLVRIQKADLILMNGGGLERPVEKALSAAGRADRLVDTSAGLDGAASSNPHVWLDPVFASSQVGVIAQAMGKRDPKNAAAYQRRAEDYQAELEKLDEEIRTALKPLAGTAVIASHDAFLHFAKRYNITLAGVLHAHAGRPPSPKQLRELRRVVQEKGIRQLWKHPDDSPQQIASAAEFLETKLISLDPMEKGTASPELYLHTMRSNLAALRAAIDGH